MTLLRKILNEGQNIACCDAASLFLIDEISDHERDLVFKLTQNDSMEFPFEEMRFALDESSIAGYVAYTDTELNIPDAYQLPRDVPYEFNRSFDRRTGYRTKSILAIPLANKQKEVIGVLQFINRKKARSLKVSDEKSAMAYTQPFDSDINVLLQALASQAGIAIENTILQNDIKALFEGFVNASVSAIEQRDPTTMGSCHWVMLMVLTFRNGMQFLAALWKPQETKVRRGITPPFFLSSFTIDSSKGGIFENGTKTDSIDGQLAGIFTADYSGSGINAFTGGFSLRGSSDASLNTSGAYLLLETETVINAQSYTAPAITTIDSNLSWGTWNNPIEDNWVIVRDAPASKIEIETSNHLALVDPTPVANLIGTRVYDSTIANIFIGGGSAGSVTDLSARFDVDFGTGDIAAGTLNVEVAGSQVWDVAFSGTVAAGVVDISATAGTLSDPGGLISSTIEANLGGVFSQDDGDSFVGGFDLIDGLHQVDGIYRIGQVVE